MTIATHPISTRTSLLVLALCALTACTAMGDSPRRRAAEQTPAKRTTVQSHTNPAAQPTQPAQAPQQAVQQSTDAGFAIDRRPVKMINTFNGNPNHPTGMQPRWGSDDHDVAMNWLKSQLQIGLDNGFTRFVLNLPAGRHRAVYPGTNKKVWMGSSHWLTLSPERRQRLKEFFPQWIAENPGVTVGYYAGFDLDPDPTVIDYIGHTIPRFEVEEDRQRMLDLIMPWVEECGFSEVWWDVASKPDRRDQAVKFSQWLAEEYGIKAGGEAITRVFPYTGKLSTEHLEAMPWMALIKYFRQHDSAKRWNVDPQTTEVFFAVRAGDQPTDLELLSAFQRGFIPWVYSNSLDDRVMKLWRQANGDGIQFDSGGAGPANSPSAKPTATVPTDNSRRRRR